MYLKYLKWGTNLRYIWGIKEGAEVNLLVKDRDTGFLCTPNGVQKLCTPNGVQMGYKMGYKMGCRNKTWNLKTILL